jgi:hypothetical protein
MRQFYSTESGVERAKSLASITTTFSNLLDPKIILKIRQILWRQQVSNDCISDFSVISHFKEYSPDLGAEEENHILQRDS